MTIKNNEKKQICCFYVSDFHLEMILLPYIQRKIKNNEQIIIETEKNLEETIKILISRTNFSKEIKDKIQNLNWKNENKKIKENSNIIIIGSKKFIEEKNQEIESLINIEIVDCYEIEEIKDKINEIAQRYKIKLNTLENY